MTAAMAFGLRLTDLALSWTEKTPIRDQVVCPTLVLDFADFRYRLPIVGRTATGKSTFLYALACLKWPRRGGIDWVFPDGRETVSFTTGASGSMPPPHWHQLRRDRFGFAFQNSALLPFLTVRENLGWPLRLRKMANPVISDRVDQVLDAITVPESDHRFLGDQYPNQLSGGQRQRVALGVAVISRPTILFADEPTGHLDDDTRRRVMERVFGFLNIGSGQSAVVWVTHHADDVYLTEAPKRIRLVKSPGQPATLGIENVPPARSWP